MSMHSNNNSLVEHVISMTHMNSQVLNNQQQTFNGGQQLPGIQQVKLRL